MCSLTISLIITFLEVEIIRILTEEATKLHSKDDQFHRRVKELTALAKKTTDFTDTVVGLAQVWGLVSMSDTEML